MRACGNCGVVHGPEVRDALNAFRANLNLWCASGKPGQFAPLGYAAHGVFVAADSWGGHYAWTLETGGPWHVMPEVAAPVTDEQIGAREVRP